MNIEKIYKKFDGSKIQSLEHGVGGDRAFTTVLMQLQPYGIRKCYRLSTGIYLNHYISMCVMYLYIIES